MTISSSSSRINYTGNGSTTAFSFPYEFQAGTDLKVYKNDTLQTITTHYTVSGGSGLSGTVTFVTAPANGDSVVIYDDPPATQLLDYIANDPFPAESHEGGLDKLTRLIRRLKDRIDRAMRLSDSDVSGASTTLPTPAASKVLGWNAAANALVNYSASDLTTVAAFSAWQSQRFSGNGATVAFTLSSDPGNVNNLDVSIGGVTQQNGVDFTVSGTTLTFTTAPVTGTNNVFVRWGQALPQSVTNANAVNYTPNGAGAVTRTLEAKIRETWVSVVDYGADPLGVANSTAAIQAAIDYVSGAGGGTVYFPRGTYILTAVLNVASQSVILAGESRYGTLLRQDTLNVGILSVTANFCGWRGLSFIYNGTPLSGATAIRVTGSYVTASDYVVRSSYVAVEWNTGVAGKSTDFDLLDYESVGLLATSLNDLFISRFIINAGNTTRGALGGIRLVNKVEAFICSDGDVLLGAYSLTTTASSYTLGNRPAYSKFTNVYFDSSANGGLIDRSVEFDFFSCWWSNRPNNGCVIGETDGIRFHGGGAINCAMHGYAVGATAVRTAFLGVAARGNGTATANTYDGISVAANTSDFIIACCTLGGGLGFGTQRYGAAVAAGTSDRYKIVNNMCAGNGTGAISDGGSGADKLIRGNDGYVTKKSGTSNIASGGTSVVVTHGLAVTPVAADISVTSTSATGSNPIYLDTTSITSTQFTVRCASAAAANFFFTWQARAKGA